MVCITSKVLLSWSIAWSSGISSAWGYKPWLSAIADNHINRIVFCPLLLCIFTFHSSCMMIKALHLFYVSDTSLCFFSGLNPSSDDLKLYTGFIRSSEISYMELAIQEGITNPCIFVQWVNRFRAAGPEALRLHKKGRKKTLNKPKIDDKPQTSLQPLHLQFS